MERCRLNDASDVVEIQKAKSMDQNVKLFFIEAFHLSIQHGGIQWNTIVLAIFNLYFNEFRRTEIHV